MPIKMRPLDKIGEWWRSGATAAGPKYAEGLTMPRTPWSQGAVGAKDAWRQGVTDAAGRDAYSKGVVKAGDAKWFKKASELGARRYPEGVGVALDDYRTGWAPFHDVLTKVELPSRRPRGDPANWERSKAVGMALRSKKLELLK